MGLQSWLASLFQSPNADSKKSLEQTQDLIGYRFGDPRLLKLALTHRSFTKSVSNHAPSNERLEFLGDSVLGLVIAHQLYIDHPNQREGDLTKAKAMLVSETTLSQVGKEIGLHEHIHLSPEEDKTGGRERASIVSDAFESVIGAVYLDGGLNAARDLILRLIYSRKSSILSDISQKNFKGDLLELIQSRGEGMPRYEVISEVGPDHHKVFHVVVKVNGDTVGEGRGLSKKEAEQKAANQALEDLQDSVV
jgi:ribonuclease-3